MAAATVDNTMAMGAARGDAASRPAVKLASRTTIQLFIYLFNSTNLFPDKGGFKSKRYQLSLLNLQRRTAPGPWLTAPQTRWI